MVSFIWLGGGDCENFVQELMFEVSLKHERVSSRWPVGEQLEQKPGDVE